MSALVCVLGRVSGHAGRPGSRRWPRDLVITVTVLLVSLVALAMILLAGSRPLRLGV